MCFSDLPRLVHQCFASETTTAASAASAAAIVHRAADFAPAAAALAAPADSSAAFRPARTFAFCGLSFPAAAVVLFQQPFPGVCLAGPKCSIRAWPALRARRASRTRGNVSAAVCAHSATCSLSALPSVIGAPRIGKVLND